jgi:uncharacterized membrane protein YagU involved in acid resistance
MRIQVKQAARRSTASARIDPFAGVLCGLVAGAAYLAAQMSFTSLIQGDSAWAPLHRMAAILLGPDAATPPFDAPMTLVGIALMIHFTLAIVYGRIVDWLVRGSAPQFAALLGAAFGLGIYVLNFWVFAPIAFPWFEESRSIVTAMDHAIFGAVAGVSCAHLRQFLHRS